MNAVPNVPWRDEFGLDSSSSSDFFASTDDIASLGTTAHIVRRAFADLALDGVLCDQKAPLIYFKWFAQPDPQNIVDLHRRFWNHGGAPILVVITPSEVQIFSGLSKPTYGGDAPSKRAGLVDTLKRASLEIQELLPSIKSGEFFRKHRKWFNPKGRVDQVLLDQLSATRKKLSVIDAGNATDEDLDALLCRLVFTCYLFDREVIGTRYLTDLGLHELNHLSDVLNSADSKTSLYLLLNKLAQDFNGDLFSDDLAAEAERLSEDHLAVVAEFFNATNVNTTQRSFLLYDFGLIPIETVSAIYERFLKSTDKKTGSFYTPRFLAEFVLDIALSRQPSLLDLRFLDPSCGSGIFLVGIFNQLAEEWRRANPNANNVVRSGALIKLLQNSIFGIDINPTACRITAFSLYLAYLDQMTPRDIQDLQQLGGVLPRLVVRLDRSNSAPSEGNIWCGDFFREDAPYPLNVDFVIGNPPWGSIADENSTAGQWSANQELVLPDKQIATAFMWKTAHHIGDDGRICLVLPYGTLFNHGTTAILSQKAFVSRHTLDLVVNLADYRNFLFSQAKHPALVMKYGKQTPDKKQQVEYWALKADWKATKAEIITISENDRATFTIESVLQDLESADAPQIWKRMTWATPRDRRLLDRLSDLPRLRDQVQQAREKSPNKHWLIAEGFQPTGSNDDSTKSSILELPTNLFVDADSPNLNLFLLEQDCARLESRQVSVRSGSNKTTRVFQSPHVLVAKGFKKIAFADFPVTFRHALRGIVGSAEDRDLLMFLTAYMRSQLAQYFLFHTSSNWGVSRSEVHVKELLRLPFPFPNDLSDPKRAKEIIEKVAQHIVSTSGKALDDWVDRSALVTSTQNEVEPLIYEYFDILPTERILIEDTVRLTIPSFQPGAQTKDVPAIQPSTKNDLEQYKNRLCDTLNAWAWRSTSQVNGTTISSQKIGIGVIILEKTERGNSEITHDGGTDLLSVLKYLQDAASVRVSTFELLRGVKIFDDNRLYIVKPLGRRHWSETAALNDADEIASSILMQPSVRSV